MRPQTVVAVCSAVTACLPYLVAAALVAAMTTLLVRTDLVAAAIADELRRHPAGKRSPHPEPVATALWTEIAGRLLRAGTHGVPSAVRIQMLVNRLRAFETERLEPLEKCLNAVVKRLLETRRKGRRIRTAVKIEQLQAITSWTKLKIRLPTTRSIGANTDDIAISTKFDVENPRSKESSFARVAKSTSGPTAVASRLEPPGGLETSLLQHEVVTLGWSSDESNKRASRETSRSESYGKTVLEEHLPWRAAESIEDVVCRLAENTVSAGAWLIYASQKHLRRASKICRAVCSAVYSERSRLVAEMAFGVLEKLVKVTADVRVADGTTGVSFELIPETEHVVNITYK